MNRSTGILFFSFCLLLHLSVHSQNREIDSLLQVLKSQSKPDTHRVNTFINIARAYIVEGKIETAIGYGQQAVDLSSKLDFQGGLSSAYQMLAYAYDDIADYPKAIETSEKAYEI